MKRLLFITLLAICFGYSQAQNIQCDIDSVNSTILMTSNYMSYCNQGMRHTKSDERYSVSLGFYASPAGSLYFLSLPIVTDEVQTVKKGNRLKLLVQNNDTITLKCSADFMSEDKFHEEECDSWVVLPQYNCSEQTVRRLMDEKVQALFQETADGKFVKVNSDDFFRWRFSKTLTSMFKAINKSKPEIAKAELLFNNGRYEYVQNDTVISTQKGITFSDKWMY